MVKIKVLVGSHREAIETLVNGWLETHRSLDIVNIQFQYNGSHVAYITYRDGK